MVVDVDGMCAVKVSLGYREVGIGMSSWGCEEYLESLLSLSKPDSIWTIVRRAAGMSRYWRLRLFGLIIRDDG